VGTELRHRRAATLSDRPGARRVTPRILALELRHRVLRSPASPLRSSTLCDHPFQKRTKALPHEACRRTFGFMEAHQRSCQPSVESGRYGREGVRFGTKRCVKELHGKFSPRGQFAKPTAGHYACGSFPPPGRCARKAHSRLQRVRNRQALRRAGPWSSPLSGRQLHDP